VFRYIASLGFALGVRSSPEDGRRKHHRHKIVYGGVDGTPEIACKLL
jgi:hypothetical protein